MLTLNIEKLLYSHLVKQKDRKGMSALQETESELNPHFR